MASNPRLFLDIETSPNVGLFWRPGRNLTIGPENILEERAVICIAWKWEGQKRVHSLHWTKNHDDRILLQKFVGDVLPRAGEVVAHNGDRFDLPWLRGRCLVHGIPMTHDIQSVDTCKLARKLFNLNSNKLDYIAKFLKVDEKLSTEYGLWKRVMANDPKALKQMVTYCKQDVVVLEQVFTHINPYAKARTHRGEWGDSCPECGSVDVVANRHYRTASGYNKTSFRCKDCGKYHTIATGRFEGRVSL